MPRPDLKPTWHWAAAGLALAAAAGAGLVQSDLTRQHDEFETQARIVHRLLSQRVVQHEAILATLALLQPRSEAAPGGPGSGPAGDPGPQARLPAVYPQVLRVLHRPAGGEWPQADLRAAEAESRRAGRAVLGPVDFTAGRYLLVQAAEPASYALQIDLAAMVPWAEWPMPRDGAIRVRLAHAAQTALLQPGVAPAREAWRFEFAKTLAAESQPFEVRLDLALPWHALPWAGLAAAALAGLGLALGGSAWQRQREARRRAEDLLRLGQAGRLNALGELAAGLAHELNQPLAALLAGAQAAQRLLAEEPPETAPAQQALALTVQQARRAAEVLQRLRRLVQPPDAQAEPVPVDLAAVARRVLDLMAPEWQRLGVQLRLPPEGAAPRVLADEVAVEQIVHNLAQNALQALASMPAGERRLEVDVAASGDGRVRCTLRDHGPGLTPEALQRAFEPFFTTRRAEQGLGLGLSLSETLAVGMGGALVGRNAEGGGAEFTLTLPTA